MSQSSSKKLIIVVAAIVMAGIVAGVVVTIMRGKAPDEPSYQGKPLSAWLKQFEAESDSAREEAQRAVRSMGEKAIPGLLARLRTSGATVARRGTASEQQAQAINGFSALGNAAAPAVPELIGMIKENEDLAPVAALALVGIGEAAVAPLTEALKSDTERLRVHAAGSLWSLKADPQLILQPLLGGLKATGDDVRAYAAVYLAGMGQPADKIVPALVENLKDPKPSVRVATCQALAKMGKAAKAAVPELQKLEKDPDESVSSEAQNALKKIGK
jgi:HEAT repeat protein